MVKRPQPPPPPKKKSAPTSTTGRRNQPPPPPGSRPKKRPAPPPPRDTEASNQSRKQSRATPQNFLFFNACRDISAFGGLKKIGQGSYGSVFLGQDSKTKECVALKRINRTKKESEYGFPVTALREVKLLQALSHKNIVELNEMATSSQSDRADPNFFMVFPYYEYDLKGILQTPEITNLTLAHIQSWMHQLRSGVHYMHHLKTMHRDLKTANLLIDKRGNLKIADLGLAKRWNDNLDSVEGRLFTNPVITLWYRPPEIIMGGTSRCCREGYTSKVDLWSVGCILAEMLCRDALIQGTDESDQLSRILYVLGNQENFNSPTSIMQDSLESPDKPILHRILKQRSCNPQWITSGVLDLLDRLLEIDPDQRWSADQALRSDFFWDYDATSKQRESKTRGLIMNFAVKHVHEWECLQKKRTVGVKKAAQNKASLPSKQNRITKDSRICKWIGR